MRLKSKDEELEHFRALENERRQHESTEGERQGRGRHVRKASACRAFAGRCFSTPVSVFLFPFMFVSC